MEQPTVGKAVAPAKGKQLHWWGRAIAGLLLLVSGGAALWLNSAVKQATVANEGLVVSPEHLNFGRVWEGSAFEVAIPIENRSDKEVEIDGFAKSCNCSSLTPEKLTIPARQSRTVLMKLDLTTGSSAPDEREFSVAFAPLIRGGRGYEKGWTVAGRVRTALRPQVSLVNVGRASILAQPLSPQSILVRSTLALRRLEAQAETPVARVGVRPVKTEKNTFEVTITPQTGLPVGAVRFDVALRPVTLAGETLPDKMIHVAGRITSDLVPFPSEVHFGSRAIGSVTEETVVITSLTNRQIEVTGIDYDARAGVDVQPIQEGKRINGKAFLLKQRVSSLQQQSTTVLFRVRAGKAADEVVKVNADYYGYKNP